MSKHNRMWKLPLKLWGHQKGGVSLAPQGLISCSSLGVCWAGEGGLGRWGHRGKRKGRRHWGRESGVTSLETKRFILCMYVFSLIKV